MIGIFAAIALALAALSFGGGYALSNHFLQGTINDLNASIIANRKEAQSTLDKEKAKVLWAEAYANKLNTDLEQAHGFAIKTINDFHDTNANARLYDHRASRKSSGCTVSKADHSKIPADTTDTTELSTESSEFLQSETKRANQLAIYANGCYNFVANNCGIK